MFYFTEFCDVRDRHLSILFTFNVKLSSTVNSLRASELEKLGNYSVSVISQWKHLFEHNTMAPTILRIAKGLAKGNLYYNHYTELKVTGEFPN